MGATREEIRRAFGTPENSDHQWLVYRKGLGIDLIYPRGNAAVEVRFNPGFKHPLTSGMGIGSRAEDVWKAYGQPREVRRINTNEGLFDDQVLYRLPRAAKMIYRSKGVLFWFDAQDRVSQFVVFATVPPRAGTTAPLGRG